MVVVVVAAQAQCKRATCHDTSVIEAFAADFARREGMFSPTVVVAVDGGRGVAAVPLLQHLLCVKDVHDGELCQGHADDEH